MKNERFTQYTYTDVVDTRRERERDREEAEKGKTYLPINEQDGNSFTRNFSFSLTFWVSGLSELNRL